MRFLVISLIFLFNVPLGWSLSIRFPPIKVECGPCPHPGNKQYLGCSNSLSHVGWVQNKTTGSERQFTETVIGYGDSFAEAFELVSKICLVARGAFDTCHPKGSENRWPLPPKVKKVVGRGGEPTAEDSTVINNLTCTRVNRNAGIYNELELDGQE